MAYTVKQLLETMPEKLQSIVSVSKTKKGLSKLHIGYVTRIFDNERELFMFLKPFIFGFVTRDNL